MHPLDMAIARLQGFLTGLEERKAKARELPDIPDDVPRFVTRDW